MIRHMPPLHNRPLEAFDVLATVPPLPGAHFSGLSYQVHFEAVSFERGFFEKIVISKDIFSQLLTNSCMNIEVSYHFSHRAACP